MSSSPVPGKAALTLLHLCATNKVRGAAYWTSGPHLPSVLQLRCRHLASDWLILPGSWAPRELLALPPIAPSSEVASGGGACLIDLSKLYSIDKRDAARLAIDFGRSFRIPAR